jgi:hypothetical protein
MKIAPVTTAPIALFTYNRLNHTRQTVEALSQNDLARDSDLCVFSDGARTPTERDAVDAVRAYLAQITGFRSIEIVCRERNLGLSRSIISGVTEVCRRYGRVIVIEDDLITSPYFLRFMNQGLDLYENEEDVISIHGYSLPTSKPLPETFFLRGADCWGWATWQRGWDLFEPDGRKLLSQLQTHNMTHEFDFKGSFAYTAMLRDQTEGRNDSWAIRWYASAFLQNRLTLYPGRSLVHNIGNDGSGTHSPGGPTKHFDTILASLPLHIEKMEPCENAGARAIFEEYFRNLEEGSTDRRSSSSALLRRLARKIFPWVLSEY